MHFTGQQGIKLHYRTYGSGPQALLAFHGFGQDSSVFRSIADNSNDRYTIFSFDLFYHGKSVLSKINTPLQKGVFSAAINQFLEEKQIRKFSLMGFSMGGKFALTLLEAFPERIEKMYLIAPDGIGTSFWYNVATYPGFLQKTFKHSVVEPAVFNQMVRLLHRAGLADKGLLKFASFQMNTFRKRLQVYRAWVGFRELTFDINLIAALLNKHNIRVQFFLGKHDKVINSRQIKAFAAKLQIVTVTVLKSGHTTLVQEVGRFLKAQE